MRSPWTWDNVQFPRLLAELKAIGLTEAQYASLVEKLRGPDETPEEMRAIVDFLLDRADAEWRRLLQGQPFQQLYGARGASDENAVGAG